MAYVIYHTETTKELTHKYFSDERVAKAQLTRMANNGKLIAGTVKEDYSIDEVGYFRENVEKTVTVKNMMSGKPVEISVNTPNCCDPSSETYWSM